ncbi:hypothetical protein FA09DRAFT_299148 [Tilletiopsis washingtonensis]|jgi:hypothetical protein|uniref:Pre-mRNA polyadenylation factor Fip1 domain-containing protein n=1 Tax=Tilletiopsis washingtonensis TaxID=58919 RepID=A0A316Z860_9BASI|nr:hypothetical protein FA09DRAFT_299148 [Tilletiopsis washingtonensis]PWN97224.1 hypothetical protein FA09DRAFT_299148 [Tilletiopsis washingtonensis]
MLPGAGPDGAPSNIYDVDPASLPDRPWRKPGADISDYFNYGFDEDSWRRYGEMKRGVHQEREKARTRVSGRRAKTFTVRLELG